MLFSLPLQATPVLLSDVPAYKWYHGCGPTAAASVLGYWDLHGYTSIADFFHTSEGRLGIGWSYQSDAPRAFTGYAASRPARWTAATR